VEPSVQVTGPLAASAKHGVEKRAASARPDAARASLFIEKSPNSRASEAGNQLPAARANRRIPNQRAQFDPKSEAKTTIRDYELLNYS